MEPKSTWTIIYKGIKPVAPLFSPTRSPEEPLSDARIVRVHAASRGIDISEGSQIEADIGQALLHDRNYFRHQGTGFGKGDGPASCPPSLQAFSMAPSQ